MHVCDIAGAGAVGGRKLSSVARPEKLRLVCTLLQVFMGATTYDKGWRALSPLFRCAVIIMHGI